MAIAMAVIAAVGALAQGRQQAAEAQNEAKIEKYKASIAESNAAIAGQQASTEEERVRREARQVMGQQRAAFAQSGTGMGGSNADVMRQDMALAELDALNVQYAGDLERRGLLQEAEGHRYNARSLKAKASAAMRMRWLTAASSAMSAYGGAKGGGGK
jgi:coproporphyrinogen III oxidase-like Fe-S oxidoreductase